jgi:hypothetical protein
MNDDVEVACNANRLFRSGAILRDLSYLMGVEKWARKRKVQLERCAVAWAWDFSSGGIEGEHYD